MDRLKKDDGFTLIELLVVILIIGILAGIAVPAFLSQREKAWDSAAEQAARSAGMAAQAAFLGADAPNALPASGNLFEDIKKLRDSGIAVAYAYNNTDKSWAICAASTEYDKPTRFRFSSKDVKVQKNGNLTAKPANTSTVDGCTAP